MNQMSLNNAILSFAFSGVLAPHRTSNSNTRPSPYPEAWRRAGDDQPVRLPPK